MSLALPGNCMGDTRAVALAACCTHQRSQVSGGRSAFYVDLVGFPPTLRKLRPDSQEVRWLQTG